ncbi:MAG: hypothetical protein IPI31_00265 [Bacteroidetes bacterium]|nr:hypothetical protein [Bacteroidota bacterium]
MKSVFIALTTCILLCSCKDRYYVAKIQIQSSDLMLRVAPTIENVLHVTYMNELILDNSVDANGGGVLRSGDGETIIIGVIDFKILEKKEILIGEYNEYGGAELLYIEE